MSSALVDAADRLAALSDFDRNIVIVAGAGTGKTSLLVGRAIVALLAKGVAAERLLMTTFTEKSAAEMAERIERALEEIAAGAPVDDGDAARSLRVLEEELGKSRAELCARAAEVLDGGTPVVETFHAFCLRVLRELGSDSGFAAELEIGEAVDLDDSFATFWRAMLERELAPEGKNERMLDARAWERILAELEPRQIAEVVEAFATASRIDAFAWDDGLEALRAEAADIDSACRDLLTRVVTGAGPTWEEVALPAFDAACAFAAAPVGSGLGPELREAFVDFATKRAPAVPSKTPEPTKTALSEQKKRLKTLARTLADYAPVACLPELETLCRRSRDALREHKLARGEISFSDCLAWCHEHLRDDLALRERIGARYEHILVDEFQDTDPIQYDILFLLAENPGAGDPRAERAATADEVELAAGRLCIVGDPKQSIYSFRGADMGAFDTALAKLVAQGARRLELRANFRSTAEILTVVNELVGPGMRADPGVQSAYAPLMTPDGSEARAGRDAGSLLHLRADGNKSENRADEALALAAWIESFVAAEPEKRRYGDIALLFRVFTQAKQYAFALRRRGIRVLVVGSRQFYEGFEVQRFVAILEAVLAPDNGPAMLAFLRSPHAGLSDREILDEWARGGRPGEPLRAALAFIDELRDRALRMRPAEFLVDLLRSTQVGLLEAAGHDGAQAWSNLEALVARTGAWCTREGRSLSEAVERIRRDASTKTEVEESPLADPGSDAVRLLTIHKAKGLEFPIVILPDLARDRGRQSSEGRFERIRTTEGVERIVPAFRSLSTTATKAIAERRKRLEAAEGLRLFYVALTRARERVYASVAEDFGSGPVAECFARAGWPIGSRAGDGVRFARHLRYEELEAVEAAPEATVRAGEHAPVILARGPLPRDEVLRPRLRRPSDAVAASAPRAAPAPRGERAPPGDVAALVGTAVHAYLERCDFGATELDETLIARALATAPPGHSELRRIASETRRILDDFLASELRTRLASVEVLGRELPILHRDESGDRYAGLVDVCFEEDGCIVVADYKTNRIDETEATTEAARYAPQLALYAHALRAGWNLTETPRAEVLFLRIGRGVTVDTR